MTTEQTPAQIEIPLGLLVEANYQALKLSLAASVAQIIAADPLMGKQVFVQIQNDVDKERNNFLNAWFNAQGEVEAISEEE